MLSRTPTLGEMGFAERLYRDYRHQKGDPFAPWIYPGSFVEIAMRVKHPVWVPQLAFIAAEFGLRHDVEFWERVTSEGDGRVYSWSPDYIDTM